PRPDHTPRPELPSRPDRRPSVVVVGSCIVDFCVSLSRLPAHGETVLADAAVRSLGGKGANQATGLRRLGGDVAIVACVGADDFAAAFCDFSRAEGIAPPLVARDPSVPTGVAFPMIFAGGGNAIAAPPGPSMRLPAAAVDAAAPRTRAAAALLLQLEAPPA